MGKVISFKLTLDGLNCANCANRIETQVNQLKLVKEASFNFSTSQLTVTVYDESTKFETVNQIKKIVNQLEPDVLVIEKIDEVKKHSCRDECCQDGGIKLTLEGLINWN